MELISESHSHHVPTTLLQGRSRILKITGFSFHFSSKVYFRNISQPVEANAASSLLDRAAEQGWRGLGRLLGAGSG